MKKLVIFDTEKLTYEDVSVENTKWYSKWPVITGILLLVSIMLLLGLDNLRSKTKYEDIYGRESSTVIQKNE